MEIKGKCYISKVSKCRYLISASIAAMIATLCASCASHTSPNYYSCNTPYYQCSYTSSYYYGHKYYYPYSNTQGYYKTRCYNYPYNYCSYYPTY